MPIYFTFVGLVIAVSGVGGYKCATVSHEDMDGTRRHIDIKFFQSLESSPYPDRFYLFNGTVILAAGKIPKVGFSIKLISSFDEFLVCVILFQYISDNSGF